MASLSAYFSYDANTMDRGIPYAQFTAFQYNTGGNAWYTPPSNRLTTAWFGAGYNLYGQLGLGNSGAGTNRNTLTPLTGNWSQVACGGYHTMALSAGTTALFGTGYNFNGQLGLGNTVDRTTPTQLTGNWSQVACGDNHTMALSAGTTKLFGTGFNEYGQLGIGTNGGAGSPWNFRDTFTALTGNWSQVACGGAHTMAISAGTTKLFGTGYNFFYQLGLGYGTFSMFNFQQLSGDWSQVTCGGDYTMALSAGTNQWFGNGDNQSGQLGLGAFIGYATTPTPLIGNWSQIACGGYHTMALSAGTNALFGTGSNDYGQLGLGNTAQRTTFTQLTGNWSKVTCGYNHTMALSAGTNQWFGTGYNLYGQLGLGNSGAGTNRNTFTQLTGNWSRVTCGGYHTMASPTRSSLTSPLVVDNFENQPTTFKMRPITNSGVTGSEASFFHNPPPVLFGTGRNLYGQLGLGDNTQRNTFNTLTGNWSQVACGGLHTMALSAGTGAWFGTGDNTYGQLALGVTAGTYHTFTRLLTGNWSSILCGGDFTFALSAGTNNQWFAAGRNFNGQLGLGNRGNGTDRNTFTALTGNWSQVACGGRHTMALSAGTGALFATGYGFQGQLGTGNSGAGAERNRFVPLTGNWSQIICGYDYTMALSAGTNTWFGTGDNGFGQLGLGDTANKTTFTQLTGNWSQMACGTYHTMALSAGTNQWFGTGYNFDGQLGLGNDGAGTDRNTFTALTGNWSQMAVGVNTTMALLAGTTQLFGTGSNANGALGLGSAGSTYNTFTALTGNWNQLAIGNLSNTNMAFAY